jgi:hypothetical protein
MTDSIKQRCCLCCYSLIVLLSMLSQHGKYIIKGSKKDCELCTLQALRLPPGSEFLQETSRCTPCLCSTTAKQAPAYYAQGLKPICGLMP